MFVAIDADTKLVASFMVGKRDAPVAQVFMCYLQDAWHGGCN